MFTEVAFRFEIIDRGTQNSKVGLLTLVIKNIDHFDNIWLK